jgi:hypothetical protein
MRNPWLELPRRSPYILPQDRKAILRLNGRVSAKNNGQGRINVNLLPEPFIGNPKTAKVVLLNLNPGVGDGDRRAHRNPVFRKAIIRNLRNESQEYFFYPLDPKLEKTPCAQWWLKHLRELFQKAGLDRKTVARRLCVIEWFPYHSQKAYLPERQICPSQEYAFRLALKALETRKLVVGMRAENRWIAVDSCLDSCFKSVPFLNSTQNCCISSGNAGKILFQQIVDALR